MLFFKLKEIFIFKEILFVFLFFPVFFSGSAFRPRIQEENLPSGTTALLSRFNFFICSTVIKNCRTEDRPHISCPRRVEQHGGEPAAAAGGGLGLRDHTLRQEGLPMNSSPPT